MNHADALAFLRAAIPSAEGETWADLGAGGGVFTRALVSLVGAGGCVYAVDADPAAVASLRRLESASSGATVRAMLGDVTQPLALPPLDGVVMANVLHFVADGEAALAGVVRQLRPCGRLVLIEYQGRAPSRWVPFPVDSARFAQMAGDAGLSPPRVVASRRSAYGGEMYVAVAERIAG